MTQNPINHRPCQATNRDRSLCLSSDTYVDVEYQLDSDSDRVSRARTNLSSKRHARIFPYSRDLL